jgi:hypothetical protein
MAEGLYSATAARNIWGLLASALKTKLVQVRKVFPTVAILRIDVRVV